MFIWSSASLLLPRRDLTSGILSRWTETEEHARAYHGHPQPANAAPGVTFSVPSGRVVQGAYGMDSFDMLFITTARREWLLRFLFYLPGTGHRGLRSKQGKKKKKKCADNGLS